MARLPTGTVTFLFTDIEGSTQLVKTLGARYTDVLAEHQGILRTAFAAHGGEEVDTQGDSFFVAFRRAKDAVAAAVDAQLELAAHAWPEGVRVTVRMGLHTGEPHVGTERYVGFGVHKAARIGAAGHGGQVLLSRATRELVADELPPHVTIRDLGARRLKDVARPEQLAQLVIEDLPSDFGELATLDAALRRRRRRVYAGAALAGVLAVAVAVLIVGEGSENTSVAVNSVAVIDPASSRVVGSVALGGRPSAIAVGAGSIWVANTEDETVSRLDAQTHQLEHTIPVGDYPGDVAFGFHAVWVLLPGVPSRLRRIALERSQAEEPFDVQVPYLGCDRARAALVAGRGALWLACSYIDGSDAARIDPVTQRVDSVLDVLLSSLPTAVKLSDVAVEQGSAWFVNQSANAVTQIDADSLLKVREVTVGAGPHAVAVGFGSIWVANADDDTVSRIRITGADPGPHSVLIAVGDEPVDIATGEDAVWVVNRGNATVSRIDPRNGTVAETTELRHEPSRIAVGEGLVWVTVQDY
jgi:YVTN family beta-propeller protein